MPDIKSQLVFDCRTDVSLNPHNIHESYTGSKTRLGNRCLTLLALTVLYLRTYSRRRASFVTSAVYRLPSHVFQRHNWATLVLFRLAQTCPESKIEAFVLRASSGTRTQRQFGVGLFLNTSFKSAVFGSFHQTSLLLLYRLRPENFYTLKAQRQSARQT
jgi:hypothetical protein